MGMRVTEERPPGALISPPGLLRIPSCRGRGLSSWFLACLAAAARTTAYQIKAAATYEQLTHGNDTCPGLDYARVVIEAIAILISAAQAIVGN